MRPYSSVCALTLAPKKVQLIQVARKRLALAEDDYRSILLNVGGSASAKTLDLRGFEAVMDRFRQLGFTSTARAATYGERAGMASPGQVAMIRRLWREAVDDPTAAALGAFLDHRFKVSALRFLPDTKAGAVITALKAMTARRATRELEGAHAGRS